MAWKAPIVGTLAGRADKTRRPGERAAVQGDRPTRGDLIMEMRAVASGAAVEFDREKAAGEQGKRTAFAQTTESLRLVCFMLVVNVLRQERN